jgi:hypothetical protein
VVPYPKKAGQGDPGESLTVVLEIIGIESCYAQKVISFQQGRTKIGSKIPRLFSNPELALGQPQENNLLNFVSLGFGGEIVLELGRKLMDDGTALPDLVIVESSFGKPDYTCEKKNGILGLFYYPEQARLEVSDNGTNWYQVGGTFCRTALIDLSPVMNDDLPYIKYLKIIDVSDPYLFGPFANGYDLDGIFTCLLPADGKNNARMKEPVARGFDPEFFNQAPNEPESISLDIYPNPVADQLSVILHAAETGEGKLRISDLLGKTIMEKAVNFKEGFNRFEWAAEGLEKGMYLLQLEGESVKSMVKFMKK